MAERRAINFSCNHQATIILYPDPEDWLDLDQFAQQIFRGACPDCPPSVDKEG